MIDEASLIAELRAFLEEAEVSRTAAKPLKDGAEIGIRILGGQSDFHVKKAGGRLVVADGPSRKPDWTAVVTPQAVHAIRALPNPDIGDLGVELLRRMARGYQDPNSEDHIKVHLTAGFFTIMRHGYLGILPLGGPKVAKFLAQHNLMSASGIKRVFKKLRGSED